MREAEEDRGEGLGRHAGGRLRRTSWKRRYLAGPWRIAGAVMKHLHSVVVSRGEQRWDSVKVEAGMESRAREEDQCGVWSLRGRVSWGQAWNALAAAVCKAWLVGDG